MYQEFFGFTEQPFSIAPDPRFLFLGPRHQEALAHLRHGLTGSGGFLLLTGEVGTGKTTLSRAIISELENELDVVFILNPRLSERELLASIAEGFGITNVSEKSSLKSLTDALSRYLTAAAKQDKHPVVLIDEAQHLFPAVLEQLRLLTNLENDSKKLLSVVLIGQPELRELLQRQELRQVAQRIVARYQLLPFTREETEQYINHRLDIANGVTSIFDKAARQFIWKTTQGTPRLINLLCDRALQIAARQNVKVVNRAIILEATTALPYAIEPSLKSNKARLYYWLLAAVAAILVVSVLWNERAGYVELPPQQAPKTTPSETATKATQINGQSFTVSLAALAQTWQLGNLGLGQQPCERLARYNLLCVKAKVSLTDVATLGVPTIAELHNGSTVLLRSVADDNWLIEDTQGYLQLAASNLEPMLTGEILLLINPPQFVNEANSQHWHTWVNSSLSALVPYSLKHAEPERQRAWLLDTTTGMSHDDSWLLAKLATAVEYKGPSFHDYIVIDYPQIREQIAISAVTEKITYSEPTAGLNQLDIPDFHFVWPNNNQAQISQEGIEKSESVDSIKQEKEAVGNAESAYALQTIFDEAVRATPAVEQDHRWSFDVELPSPVTVPVEQAENNQGVPLLTELSSEQRESIPSFSYEQHVYQSSPTERWIGLGQNRLREGEHLGDLKVISIQPGYSILSVGDMLFRVEALEDL